MLQKKILVPLGASGTDLKSVHYALALAERLRAQVYILHQAPRENGERAPSMWLDEALFDLINSAREAGLAVSHYVAQQALKEEIVALTTAENIDILVFSGADGVNEQVLAQVKPLIPCQIIQVKEKDRVDYL